MISIGQAFVLASSSVRSAKMRSALTTLGIIIGVAAVVANVSIGTSFNQYFNDELGSMGSNFIIIYSQDVNIFHDAQLELIKDTPGVVGVSAFNQQKASVTYLSTVRQIDVQGVNEDTKEISNLQMGDGSFLTDKDKYVAVLGNDVADKKFGRNIPVKNYIDITFMRHDGTTVTRQFRVKGVLEKEKSAFVSGGPNRDISVFIPIQTFNELLGTNDYSGFSAKAESSGSVRAVAKEIDQRLARNLGVPARDLDNVDAKPYHMFNQADILERLDMLSATLTILITLIALVALLVGSIGIMNIMLVTVTERTREIGLLKSLGYTRTDILTIFMLESVIVGLIGGILGTLLGLAGSIAVETYLNIPRSFPLYLVVLGFLISVLVGLVAGVYPAGRAASMDPVKALRHK